MKLLLIFLLTSTQLWAARTPEANHAYAFLKKKSIESKPQTDFNQYEDIISGSIAFAIGNIGYFTTDSSALKLAYSGVQTVGIIAVGHGIHDYYYPHFETRLLELMNKEKMTRGELSDGYIKLLGERDRARRVALLTSSSLLTAQYAFNALISKDVSGDLKDIYLFLGGVNAIVAIYSWFEKSDFEKYYLEHSDPLKVGYILAPLPTETRAGMSLTYSW